MSELDQISQQLMRLERRVEAIFKLIEDVLDMILDMPLEKASRIAPERTESPKPMSESP